MANIYELTRDLRELQDMMASAETPDENEAIRNTLAGLSGEAGDLVEGLAKMIRNLTGEADAITSEVARLERRESAMRASANAAAAAIKALMEAGGYKSMRTALFSITLREGSESVEVVDMDALPDDLVRVVTDVKPDKKAIKEAIRSGREVTGARMVRGEKSITIR